MTQDFGANLKLLRKLYGYTQEDLAKAINTSRSCISNYESGRRLPDSTTLSLIANVFDISTDYMLGRSPVKIAFVNETVLESTYLGVEMAENIKSLDISDSSAEIKCAILDFYEYLLAKESATKKRRSASKNK